MPTNKENPEKMPREQTIAKRKNAGEELRDSELSFRSLYENSFDALLLTKPGGHILGANPAAQRMFGMSEEEIQKAGRKGIVVIDERAEPALRERARTGKAKAEFTFRRKDGSTFEGEAASSIFTDSDGIVKTSMIIRDITERKKAEEALQSSEKQKNDILESITDGFVAFDKEWRYTYVNSNAARLLRKPKAELIGKLGIEVFPNASKFLAEFKRAVSSGRPVHFEEYYPEPLNIWYECHCYPSQDGLTVFFSDITQRKKAEEALRLREVHYRTLFSSIGEGFELMELIFDENKAVSDLRYLEVNDTYEKQTGLKAKDVLGKTVKELFPNIEGKWIEVFDKVIKTGMPTRLEDYHQDTNRYYSVYYFPFGKKQVGVLFSDITERKKSEKALKQSEHRYQQLFNSMTEMFQVIEIIFDKDGKAIDYYYREVNPAFEKLVKKTREQLIDKRVKAIFGIVEDYWLEAYNRVAQTGNPAHFENYGAELEKWYDVYVWKASDKQVAITFADITERKKAEEALRKSEERFRTVFEKTALGIVIGDMEGHVVESNSALGLMLGYSVEELKGKLFSEFTYPADVSLEWPLVRDLIAGKYDKYEIEKRYIRKDGEIIWVHLTGNIIFGRNKEPLIGVATIEDISKRKKAEEVLKRSQELISNQLEEIKSYYDNAPVGLAILDEELRYIRVNNRFAEMDGMPAEEHIGKTVREVVPTLAEKAEELPRKIIKSGEAVRNIEFLGETASCPGEKRTWLESWIPIKDSLGDVTALYVMAEDITERKKAEARLEEYGKNLEKLVEERTKQLELTSAYARNLLEASLDPLVTINKEGKITDVNKATEDVTGCVREEMLGSDFSNYFTEPDQARDGYKKAFTEGIVKDYPLAIKHTGGKITHVLYNATVYTNDSGEIQGVFAAARDITELKKAEEEAQEAAKKLKDSERLAAIGATAGMVGHDIRNPLQAITGDLFLAKTELADLPDNEQKKNAVESLDEIQSNIDYINKIVADLQDYARPLNPRAQEADITSVCNEMLTKNGIPKNVKVTLDVEDEAGNIVADPDYLKRIIGNLTLNAVQAMPNGGELTIRAYLDKKTNDNLITVSDTGVGIPEDVKTKLFTPMMTTKSKGQGFGLAVVKRMTEGLGGIVTFESQEGKGTTFIVRLPPPKS